MTDHKESIASLQAKLKTLSPEEIQQLLPRLAEDPRQGVKQLVEKYHKAEVRRLAELERYQKMTVLEKEGRAQGFQFICGTDEAGRGPLAGPVVAAAVILSENAFIPGLNDSKKLSEKKRESLATSIKSMSLTYGIASASVEEIASLNILHAAELAMKRAIEQCDPRPDLILIDGENRIDLPVYKRQIIQGDSRSVSIAAASILAKVTRDHMMMDYDKAYPGYGFAEHKGYGTKAHYDAIEKMGILPIHRRGFRLYR